MLFDFNDEVSCLFIEIKSHSLNISERIRIRLIINFL